MSRWGYVWMSRSRWNVWGRRYSVLVALWPSERVAVRSWAGCMLSGEVDAEGVGDVASLVADFVGEQLGYLVVVPLHLSLHWPIVRYERRDVDGHEGIGARRAERPSGGGARHVGGA